MERDDNFWLEWLKSEDGRTCNNWDTLNDAEYLTNRLWWAFQAGHTAATKSSQFANCERIPDNGVVSD